MARDNSIAQHMYTHRLNCSARHNSCSMPAHKAAILKAYDIILLYEIVVTALQYHNNI